MSDDLTISTGGSTSVVTEELRENARQLAELSRATTAARARLVMIDALVSGWSLGLPAANRAEFDIELAKAALSENQVQAHTVAMLLNQCADGYEWVERTAGRVIGGVLSNALGHLLPALAGPATVGAAAALVGIARQPGWLRENNEWVTNPVMASAVRTSAQFSGEFVAGLAGIVPLAATLAGGERVGARALMAGTPAPLLGETGVRLADQQSLEPRPAAVGAAGRLSRVPHPELVGGGQVVIDRYSQADGPDRFEVYVAGTVTFSPVAGAEPWDMTSNIANAAGVESGSFASVAEAMRDAGVDPHSPVQFVGYSQGGGTVAELAASGRYNTSGLISFGGPTGQIAVPESIPAVLVEHTDDIVPALGGFQENANAVVVEREVFAGRPIPELYAVPSHHIEYYEETARLMDGSHDPQLTAAMRRLDAFTAGATPVSSTIYRFERDREFSEPSVCR